MIDTAREEEIAGSPLSPSLFFAFSYFLPSRLRDRAHCSEQEKLFSFPPFDRCFLPSPLFFFHGHWSLQQQGVTNVPSEEEAGFPRGLCHSRLGYEWLYLFEMKMYSKPTFSKLLGFWAVLEPVGLCLGLGELFQLSKTWQHCVEATVGTRKETKSIRQAAVSSWHE